MNTMTKAHQIRKAAAAKFGCKVSEIHFGECLWMAHNGEDIKVATEQQLAIQQGIKDTAAHFKANTSCDTAGDEIYEQLAMIYMHHRGAGMGHGPTVEKSFARLNENRVSNADMVILAQKTIAAQASIVNAVKAQAGFVYKNFLEVTDQGINISGLGRHQNEEMKEAAHAAASKHGLEVYEIYRGRKISAQN